MKNHVNEIEHDEHCPDCGAKLDLRYVGKHKFIYYCKECTKHHILDPVDVKNGGIQK